jgi:membrane protein required for colicin V production
MTPMLFDVIVVALLLLSLALGFMRGFCNEVFTIFGWIGAVLATIYFTPVAKPIGRDLIEKDWLADIATASVIFIVTMGIFSAVSYFATKSLHVSKLNIVDRSMGFGFGLLRAVILFGLCFTLFAFVFSDAETRPDFVQKSRTRPFLEASSKWVQAIIPGVAEDVDTDSDLDKVMRPEDEILPVAEPQTEETTDEK